MTFTPGPGIMMGPEIIDWCAAHVAGLEIERYDAVAGHHTPEDRPDVIAADWMGRHGFDLE